MLKSIFENFTFIQKIQIYLLVPMFFWLLLFSIENIFFEKNRKNNSYEKNIVSIEKNKIEKTIPDKVVKFIEQEIGIYKVALRTIHIENKTISLEVRGGLKNSLSFLKKLQFHLAVHSYKLLKEKRGVVLNIVIDSEYFFNKGLIESKKTVHHKLGSVKINAIIGGEVLIDGLWYKQGESYKKSYMITKIEQQFIELKHIKTDKRLKVKLINESL